jgi:hypothetical protein
MRRSLSLAVALTLSVVGVGAAQVTGTPSYDAPYRAFARHEAGVVLSFPNPGTAFEGEYRFGYQKFDLGLKGGLYDPGSGASKIVLLGVEGRQRVITHTEEFPLDGAVIVGLGANLVSNFSGVIIPAGLSLGRLIELKNSPVTITPYGEPVVFLTAGNNQSTDFHFAFGLGSDFRLSKAFDLRVSGSLGDIDGVSVGAVWIR